MENILEVKHLSKSYNRTVAVNDIHFEIGKGQITGLLGPNGSGKTTIIKILNDLIHDYRGSVSFCGKPPGVFSKKHISYLPDRLHIPEDMKPAQCINMFRDFYEDFESERAEKIFDQMEIPLHKTIAAFSKGVKEKVMLALVMSRRARLYILDEPLAGIDPAARDLILKTILSNFDEESSMLISTHLISEVENVFDRVIFLKKGEIFLDDEVENIRQKENKSVDQLFREVFSLK